MHANGMQTRYICLRVLGPHGVSVRRRVDDPVVHKSAVECVLPLRGPRRITPFTIYPYKQFYRSIIDSTYDSNYLHEVWSGAR